MRKSCVAMNDFEKGRLHVGTPQVYQCKVFHDINCTDIVHIFRPRAIPSNRVREFG
jgi:hypothetical protein